MRSLPALGLLLATTFLSPIASALITQPNGIIVPVDSGNGEIQLHTFFQNRNESIDYRIDANPTPGTFSPACDFRATLVLRQAGASYALGWYNVNGTPPAAGDIHPLIPAGSPVGTVAEATVIRNDPAWQGGLVGFALLGDQTHYSQPALGPICTGCNPAAPWIMAAAFVSKKTANAYYLAFEDGTAGATPNSFNNDGDYNDYVLYLEGAVCPDAGLRCDTGKPGVCAPGITVCNPNGVTCQARVEATSEQCNGLDDDCNGLVDDGTALCPDGQVCHHGACVARCTATSCPSGKACSGGGTCVESACATKTCSASEVCTNGACREACADVVCPAGQVCQGDRCVNPCAGVTCGSGELCDRGVCRRRCDCLPCEPGLSCNVTSGACVETGCATVSCAAGTICRAGACVDACTDVKCPPDQICAVGQCVDRPNVEDAGVSNDAGTSDSGAADAATGDASASYPSDGGADPPIDEGGCTCGTPGRSAYGPASAAWAIAAAAIVARWRRRARVRGSR